MPFNWQAPPSLDPNGTIGSLMLRGPEAIAQGQIEAARARAAATANSGQIWGNAIAGAGNSIAQGVQQATDPARKIQAIQLQNAQELQGGKAAYDKLMQRGIAPGEEGPRQNFLTEDGLFDIPKITESLAQGGMAHLAPELTKPAEAINESLLKFKALDQQRADRHTLLLGDMANGVSKLVSAGTPIDQAIQFVTQPGIHAQILKPEEVADITKQLQALPPDQQQKALGSLMDAAAKLDKGDTLAKDAVHIDRYGRTESSNIVQEKPKTRAELAADAANPASPTHEQSARALELDKPTVEKPPRPLDQQLLEAIAKGDKAAKDNILATIAADANAKRDPVAQAQLAEIRNLSQQAAQDRLDNNDPQSAKNQQKFEQEYRTVLQRGLSSRSGGLGLEDAKVQQANHLMSIFEQNYDPKAGEWNIPRVQLNELALGLARLTAPGGQAGEGMLREFQQRTAKGDLTGALTYLTGEPLPANTQAITQMLKDSIDRQGRTAMTNREGEMAYLRGLAPTDLSEERRKKLETTSLNPLRESRVIRNSKTGETKLQVSTDGGKTWQ